LKTTALTQIFVNLDTPVSTKYNNKNIVRKMEQNQFRNIPWSSVDKVAARAASHTSAPIRYPCPGFISGVQRGGG